MASRADFDALGRAIEAWRQRESPTFVVSRRRLYGGLANRPEVAAMAAWGERLHRAQRENHDPGDEDRDG